MKKGDKIVVFLDAGMTGTDFSEFYELGSDYTDDELNSIIWNMALDNAETYGIYDANTYNGDEEDAEEEEIELSYNIEGYYEIYDPKSHDMYSFSDPVEFQLL